MPATWPSPWRTEVEALRRRVSPKLAFGILVGLLLVALILAASFVARRDSEDVGTASEAPGVEHVHGLGVDPSDGTLFAATHFGLFRIPDEGKATRIADRYQDTMGFTVVGDAHFLGSGHPDMRDAALRKPGRPPLLGLIESKDAGETWKPVSLLGEADFHGLVAAHHRVYGFDSTNSRFMVSNDKTTWETRSTLSIASFAVDPADGERIVATTGEGLLESTDGGRTWKPIAGPQLDMLSWDERSGLWGADRNGVVHRHPTNDESWMRASALPGAPEALLAQDDALYAAASGPDGVTGIYRSGDGGSWKLLYRDAGA